MRFGAEFVGVAGVFGEDGGEGAGDEGPGLGSGGLSR
jgi:hypothetical protein